MEGIGRGYGEETEEGGWGRLVEGLQGVGNCPEMRQFGGSGAGRSADL